jgi:peptide/nickel transport system substrate-binding protein
MNIKRWFAVVLCALLSMEAQAQDTPQKGGTMIVGNGDDPRVLSSNFSFQIADTMVGCMVYEGLLRFGPGFKLMPGLAKSWEVTPDGKTYTMHLDESKWEDGKPVTSEDVAWSLMNISAKYGPKFIPAGKVIDNIDTSDPHTVVFHLKQPFGPFLFSLVCEQNAGIMPKHIFETGDILTNPALTTKPIGSGAFRVSEWVHGDHITMVRNPDYRRPGKPYLDKVILKTIPDSAGRVLALQAGEIDMIEELYFPLTYYKTLSADKRFQVHDVGYGADDLVLLNVKNTPLDRAEVRQALMVAIDREYMFKNVYLGLGRMATSIVDSRLSWAKNPAVDYGKMYAYDPDRARKMLDDAGVKPGSDGTRFTIRLAFSANRADDVQAAQVLQRNWQAVGIKVVLQGTEGNLFATKVFGDYDFDAAIANYSTGGDVALGVARLYTTDAIRKGSVYVNGSRYSNPEVDALFSQGRDAPTQEERAKAYFKVQEILAKELPVLTLHEQPQIDAASSNMRDLFLAAFYPWWDEIWIKH